MNFFQKFYESPVASKIFSKRIVNTEHQIELDLWKAVLVFIMVVMHVQDVVFGDSWISYTLCNRSRPFLFFNKTIYPIGATIFMFSMGCSINFSRHQETKACFQRGLCLLLTFFCLNAIRGVFIAFFLAKWNGSQYVSCWIRSFFFNDILLLASLFYFYYGFLKWCRLSFRGVFLVTTGLFILSNLIPPVHISGNPDSAGNIALNQFLGCFVFINNKISSFPLCNWAFVVILGIAFGKLLQHCFDKDTFYAVLTWVGLIGLSFFFYFLIQKHTFSSINLNDKDFHLLDFHRANYGSVLYSILHFCLYAGLFYQLMVRLRNWEKKFLFNFINYCSKNLTVLYFIHWPIVTCIAAVCCGSYTKMKPYSIQNGTIWLAIFGVYAATLLLSWLYNHLLCMFRNRNTPQTTPK